MRAANLALKFLLEVAAIAALAGAPVWAAVFAGVVVVNAVLLTVFDQWEA